MSLTEHYKTHIQSTVQSLVTQLTDKKCNKEEVLKEFVNLWKGIQQRDKEWYKLIGTTIGGSEIAALLGLNPYTTRDQLIDAKVQLRMGISTFNGGPATRWGVIFEDILGVYVEEYFGTKIYGDNICIQMYKGHRNSPDGYMVVYLYDMNKYWGHSHSQLALPDKINTYINNRYGRSNDVPVPQWAIWNSDLDGIDCELDAIVVLEFKCPYSRVPATIQKYYKPQVLSGLSVSPVAEFGIFGDACFRKCKITDLGFNLNYDQSYHGYKAYKTVYTFGIIKIFGNCPLFGKNRDFGAACSDFNLMLELVDSGTLRIERMPPMYEILANFNIDENEHSAASDFIGYLPWKLMANEYTIVEPEPDYLQRIYPTIESFHHEVERRYKKLAPQKEFEELTEKALNLLI